MFLFYCPRRWVVAGGQKPICCRPCRLSKGFIIRQCCRSGAWGVPISWLLFRSEEKAEKSAVLGPDVRTCFVVQCSAVQCRAGPAPQVHGLQVGLKPSIKPLEQFATLFFLSLCLPIHPRLNMWHLSLPWNDTRSAWPDWPTICWHNVCFQFHHFRLKGYFGLAFYYLSSTFDYFRLTVLGFTVYSLLFLLDIRLFWIAFWLRNLLLMSFYQYTHQDKWQGEMWHLKFSLEMTFGAQSDQMLQFIGQMEVWVILWDNPLFCMRYLWLSLGYLCLGSGRFGL